ncbi:MAG TPA: hypothetical protein VFB38_07520 [Chthonomonadaceae bacterium]|nr:hypothetical protein [Chthonomonadaceae bacterium]
MRANAWRAVAVGFCLLWSVSAAQAAGSKIAWAKSFSTAMAQAKLSHKLVMADFYTDW